MSAGRRLTAAFGPAPRFFSDERAEPFPAAGAGSSRMSRIARPTWPACPRFDWNKRLRDGRKAAMQAKMNEKMYADTDPAERKRERGDIEMKEASKEAAKK